MNIIRSTANIYMHPSAHLLQSMQNYTAAMFLQATAQSGRTFPRGDAGINHDLCSIKEISELCLPQHQIARALHAEAVLEPQHRFLTQRTVGNLRGVGGM